MPPYPRGVVAVPEPIAGTAFFPGGLGLWLEEDNAHQPLPKDFMIVGQDFNTLATYERARILGSEANSSATWRNIRKIFPELNIPLTDCFFTNIYMGLRAEGRETGRFPGARDRNFVERCAAFFRRQMEAVQPKIILTLGMEPLRVLGSEVFGFTVPRRLFLCDRIYGPFLAKHGEVAVVPLTHPSWYLRNVARRRFCGETGIAAEIAMVQAAKSLVER